MKIIGVCGSSAKGPIERIKNLCDALELTVVDSIEFAGSDASKNKKAIEETRKLGEKIANIK